MNRREFTLTDICGLTAITSLAERLGAARRNSSNDGARNGSVALASFAANNGRPSLGQRAFVSEAVESTINEVKTKIPDLRLAALLENCFPNTFDTAVRFSERDGKPDTFVITGDIAAMWLRDSSAQLQPYLALAKSDTKLRRLFQGLIHRQAHCILLDAYANAFYATPRMGTFSKDLTEMRPGVHERKWEIDSLCYPYGSPLATGLLRETPTRSKTTGAERPGASWPSSANSSDCTETALIGSNA